jgi:hypothetical protein
MRRDLDPAPATAGWVIPVPEIWLSAVVLLDRDFREKKFGRDRGLSSRLEGRWTTRESTSSEDDPEDAVGEVGAPLGRPGGLLEKMPRDLGRDLSVGLCRPGAMVPFLSEE